MANEYLTAEGSKTIVPVGEKYMLTMREAAEYFNIEVKKMRRLAEDNLGRFASAPDSPAGGRACA